LIAVGDEDEAQGVGDEPVVIYNKNTLSHGNDRLLSSKGLPRIERESTRRVWLSRRRLPEG
jgi:hypothetical protein